MDPVATTVADFARRTGAVSASAQRRPAAGRTSAAQRVADSRAPKGSRGGSCDDHDRHRHQRGPADAREKDAHRQRHPPRAVPGPSRPRPHRPRRQRQRAQKDWHDEDHGEEPVLQRHAQPDPGHGDHGRDGQRDGMPAPPRSCGRPQEHDTRETPRAGQQYDQRREGKRIVGEEAIGPEARPAASRHRQGEDGVRQRRTLGEHAPVESSDQQDLPRHEQVVPGVAGHHERDCPGSVSNEGRGHVQDQEDWADERGRTGEPVDRMGLAWAQGRRPSTEEHVCGTRQARHEEDRQPDDGI
jgi:hypothetical protein